jgi:hypothetical protein
MPEWIRIRTGPNSGQAFVAPDGSFTVHGWGPCLVELVRNPRRTHYRLRAKVRHDRCDSALGVVGLFFALREHPTPEGPLLIFGQLTFNGVTDVYQGLRLAKNDKNIPIHNLPGLPDNVPDANPVTLGPCLCSLDADKKPTPQDLGGQLAFLCKPTGSSETIWRSLVVEVTPNTIRAFWDDKIPVGAITPAAWDTILENSFQNALQTTSWVKHLPLHFAPEGSLGLMVYNAIASFRDVAVEPFDDKDTVPNGGKDL